MNLGGDHSAVLIEKGRMMTQIGLLVLVPLFLGLLLRAGKRSVPAFLERAIPVFNQCLILAIVWMSLSGARDKVLNGGSQMAVVVVL